jgi:hypothetical protein
MCGAFFRHQAKEIKALRDRSYFGPVLRAGSNGIPFSCPYLLSSQASQWLKWLWRRKARNCRRADPTYPAYLSLFAAR